MIESKSTGDDVSELGTSAVSTDDATPATRVTTPMRASACGPTTLPGPIRSCPEPPSVFKRSEVYVDSEPVRSSGPVTA